MNLSVIRTHYADVVREAVGDDVSVIDYIPDSVTPPTVAVAWMNPWLTADTLCAYTSQLELIVVSQRIEPGGHLTVIEDLVATILDALRTVRAVVRNVTSPYPIVLGGVNYLAASINIIHDVEE